MTMEQTIHRNLLKEAVGRAIFCPACKRVLDVRRAVELDYYRASDGIGTSGLAGVRVLCTSCYDAKCADGKLKAQLEGTGLHFEVIDGRALFGTGTPRTHNRGVKG